VATSLAFLGVFVFMVLPPSALSVAMREVPVASHGCWPRSAPLYCISLQCHFI